jgi:hypothetical protein
MGGAGSTHGIYDKWIHNLVKKTLMKEIAPKTSWGGKIGMGPRKIGRVLRNFLNS